MSAVGNVAASEGTASGLLAAAFEHSADGLVLLDAARRVQAMNAAAGRLLGLRSGAQVGRPWFDLLVAAGADAQAEVPAAGSGTLCVAFPRGSAGVEPVTLRFDTFDGHGLPAGTVVTLRAGEPAERLRSALDQSEQRLALACASGNVGLWEWDVEDDTLHEYGAWVGRTRHTADGPSTHGTRLMQHTHADDIAAVRAALLDYLRGVRPHYAVEQRVERVDGGYVRFLVRGLVSERGADGRARHLVGTYTDVTALREQEHRLEFALECSQHGIWEWTAADDRIEEHSSSLAVMESYGLRAPLLGREFVERLHPDDRTRARDVVLSHLRNESASIECELRVRRPAGGYGYLLVRGRAAERTAGGRVQRILGTYTEVSALKAQEQRLRIALENGRQGLWEWRPVEGRIEFSPEWYALLGYPEGSITDVVRDLAPIVHPDDAGAVVDGLRALLKGEMEQMQAEQRYRHRDGHELTLLARGSVVERDGHGRARRVLGTHVDITAIKHAEAALAASRKLLETVIDAFPQRVFWKDADNRYLGCNARFAADAGYASPAEVVGRHTSELPWPALPSILEEDQAILDGSLPEVVSERNFAPVQGSAFWAQTTKVPLPAADGGIAGIVGMYEDVSTRRQRERELKVIANALTSGLQTRLLNALTRAAAELAEAAHAVVALRNDDGTATITACYPSRKPLRGATYALAGSPCEFTLARGRYHCVEDAAERFAEDRHLASLGIASYFGRRLDASDGTAVGIFALLFTAPRVDEERLRTVIDIFAARATAELERERTHSVLLASERRLNAAIESGNQGVWEWDLGSDRLLTFGTHFRRLGLSDAGGYASGDELVERVHPEDHAGMREALVAYFRGLTPSYVHEVRLRDHAGAWHWTQIRGQASDRDDGGRVLRMVGTHTDISALKQAEAEAQRLALYDPLTNLPNRRYFTERLAAELSGASRHGSCGALLFLDMDQFKRINDTLGHSVGDALLQAIAARLLNVTRQEDMVARLGGDEFVILLPNLANDFDACARQARTIADKIHQSLGQPFQFDHHQFHITPTIGISLFPEPGKGVEEVLREADTAMYSGKAAGRNVTRFFMREMEQRAHERLRLEGDLRLALKRDEFELYYQPQVDGGGRVVGAEALLRWRHPAQGLVPPGLFIPIAEERGLIVDIGAWVLERAFATYERWIVDGKPDLAELSINVSSRQFRAGHFVVEVERLLERYRVPAERVVLELTEGTVIEDVGATIAIMERLRRLGLKFAVDDFGVGYSSLSYLKRLPIDQLKIDRSFTADIGEDLNDEVICRTIIAMGRHLGLETVAEGVETAQQFAFLHDAGCNRYQGYRFLAPSPAPAFIAYCGSAAAR